jgi:fatty acid desaturase
VTKATMHDELMHEAGFETDSHRELEERRTERRRRIIVLISLAAAAAIEVALLALGIPHPWGLGGIPWLFIPAAVFWVMRRVLDRLGLDEEGRRL